jgi:hypothetical protein
MEQGKKFRTEAAFRQYVKKRLQEHYGELIWIFAPPTLQLRGIPDLIMCVGSLFVAWELKLDGARVDPSREKLQEFTCQKIARALGVSRARVTPKTFERDFAVLNAVVDDYLGEVGIKKNVHS